MKKNWYSITANSRDNVAKIAIYDEIGSFGISSKKFYDDLVNTTQRTQPVTVHINSPGGSIFDGLAIYNMLKNHTGRVTVQIDGLAASMASIVAMAGDEIIMPENALMMIHNPSGFACGDAGEMRDYADLLDKCRDSMVTIYTDRTGLPQTAIIQAMDQTTWYTGTDAVNLGFADRLTDPVRLAACADLGSYDYIPDTVAGTFTKRHSSAQSELGVISALASFAEQLNKINLGDY